MHTPQETTTAREKVAETVLAYYRQLEAHPPTAHELAAWFDGLDLAGKGQMLTLGLGQAIKLHSFQRQVLEKHGYRMASYMAAHLTPLELTHWVDDGDGGVRT